MKKICKVLIVEDDSDIRELLSGTFADQGYRFVMATNAAEMRSALASDPELDIVRRRPASARWCERADSGCRGGGSRAAGDRGYRGS
jgi:hypothetical protein